MTSARQTLADECAAKDLGRFTLGSAVTVWLMIVAWVVVMGVGSAEPVSETRPSYMTRLAAHGCGVHWQPRVLRRSDSSPRVTKEATVVQGLARNQGGYGGSRLSP